MYGKNYILSSGNLGSVRDSQKLRTALVHNKLGKIKVEETEKKAGSVSALAAKLIDQAEVKDAPVLAIDLTKIAIAHGNKAKELWVEIQENSAESSLNSLVYDFDDFCAVINTINFNVPKERWAFFNFIEKTQNQCIRDIMVFLFTDAVITLPPEEIDLQKDLPLGTETYFAGVRRKAKVKLQSFLQGITLDSIAEPEYKGSDDKGVKKQGPKPSTRDMSRIKGILNDPYFVLDLLLYAPRLVELFRLEIRQRILKNQDIVFITINRPKLAKKLSEKLTENDFIVFLNNAPLASASNYYSYIYEVWRLAFLKDRKEGLKLLDFVCQARRPTELVEEEAKVESLSAEQAQAVVHLQAYVFKGKRDLALEGLLRQFPEKFLVLCHGGKKPGQNICRLIAMARDPCDFLETLSSKNSGIAAMVAENLAYILPTILDIYKARGESNWQEKFAKFFEKNQERLIKNLTEDAYRCKMVVQVLSEDPEESDEKDCVERLCLVLDNPYFYGKFSLVQHITFFTTLLDTAVCAPFCRIVVANDELWKAFNKSGSLELWQCKDNPYIKAKLALEMGLKTKSLEEFVLSTFAMPQTPVMFLSAEPEQPSRVLSVPGTPELKTHVPSIAGSPEPQPHVPSIAGTPEPRLHVPSVRGTPEQPGAHSQARIVPSVASGTPERERLVVPSIAGSLSTPVTRPNNRGVSVLFSPGVNSPGGKSVGSSVLGGDFKEMAPSPERLKGWQRIAQANRDAKEKGLEAETKHALAILITSTRAYWDRINPDGWEVWRRRWSLFTKAPVTVTAAQLRAFSPVFAAKLDNKKAPEFIKDSKVDKQADTTQAKVGSGTTAAQTRAVLPASTLASHELALVSHELALVSQELALMSHELEVDGQVNTTQATVDSKVAAAPVESSSQTPDRLPTNAPVSPERRDVSSLPQHFPSPAASSLPPVVHVEAASSLAQLPSEQPAKSDRSRVPSM